MRKSVGLFIVLCLMPALAAWTDNVSLLQKMENDARCQQWVDSVMRTLSLKERIGQLMVYTIAPTQDKANVDLLRKVVREYKIGGLLFSKGEIQDQVALTNQAQQWADVPLMITLDGEWGLAMRLKDTPRFPRNMVLGCIRNDSLLYEYGREVARECREMGIQVNFAPVADVNINPRNPVINTRSFGEDPKNVARKVTAYARGLEDGGVLSVSKHFPGHGDTNVDSHAALPTLPFTRERLDSIELYPFRKAIEAGLGGIMVGHLAVPVIEPEKGLPASQSPRIVRGLLQEEMGFPGLVFTDALVMKGAAGHGSVCKRALQAGSDVLLVPRRIKEEVEAILRAVRLEMLPEAEINRRCRKVLTYKYALGLSRKPHVQLSGLTTRLNTADARKLISRLRLASTTLVSNRNGALPLDPSAKRVAVLHVGTSKTDFRPFLNQLSQYVTPIECNLTPQTDAYQRAELLRRIESCQRLLVCVTTDRLKFCQDFLNTLQTDKPVVYLLYIDVLDAAPLQKALKRADAVILAHSTHEDVQQHTAALLYGEAGADGRLSASIGNTFPVGTGVTLEAHTRPRYNPNEHGMSAQRLAQIDEIAEEGIRQGAYPGCQVVIWKDGMELYNKTFGTQDGTHPLLPTDVYDLASLTKTTATLLAVMKLYDQGRLSLTDRASEYLPFLHGTNKQDITLSSLLFHESGLPGTILFYQEAIDSASYKGSLFSARRDRVHTAQIARNTWANPSFRFRPELTSPVRTMRHTLHVCDSLWLDASFKDEMMQQIADARLYSCRYRYSCVGFILLQQVVEAIAGKPMDQFLNEEFYRPMGLKRTGYHPLEHLPKIAIVPSAEDDFIRKEVLRGYVHDESAAFIGGVSGNAGLFSNASEVACIYQMLLNGGIFRGHRYLSAETCKVFTTRTSRISRRGLGFDKPDTQRPRSNPCSTSTPASVYGHTGFTGTCAWCDPDNKLVYVFLSNRVYPQPWNNLLMVLEIRERIQETMYRALREGKR